MPFKLTFRSGLVLYPFHPLRTMAENRQIKEAMLKEAFSEQLPYGVSETTGRILIDSASDVVPGMEAKVSYLANVPLSADGVKRRAHLMATRKPIKVQKQSRTREYTIGMEDVGEIL